jgi:hypothetical protein
VYATDGEILFRQCAYFHYLFGVAEEGFWGAVDTRDVSHRAGGGVGSWCSGGIMWPRHCAGDGVSHRAAGRFGPATRRGRESGPAQLPDGNPSRTPTPALPPFGRPRRARPPCSCRACRSPTAFGWASCTGRVGGEWRRVWGVSGGQTDSLEQAVAWVGGLRAGATRAWGMGQPVPWLPHY